MSHLSDYMNNIIHVVNQHAKLLDDIATELACRPKQNQVGELFALLAQGFPYERSLKQMGLSSHPPRHPRIVEGLGAHQIPINLELSKQ